jgi:catechol 2,3-dioxygenase-like lactoylglutathione lyase family enzyme
MTDTSPLAPANLYHLGMVVPDVDEAAARYSAVAGYRWTIPVEGPVAITTDTGDHEVVLKIVYSIQGPHLELIQEVPGTIWTASPNAAAHHLGYWVDDLAYAAAHLESEGYRQEARPAGETLTLFAYYLDPTGVRIELVDRNMFPDFPGMLESMAA